MLYAHVAQLDSSDRLLSDRPEVRILSWVPERLGKCRFQGVPFTPLDTVGVKKQPLWAALAIFRFSELQLFHAVEGLLELIDANRAGDAEVICTGLAERAARADEHVRTL